jgi:hypothetical protein
LCCGIADYQARKHRDLSARDTVNESPATAGFFFSLSHGGHSAEVFVWSD